MPEAFGNHLALGDPAKRFLFESKRKNHQAQQLHILLLSYPFPISLLKIIAYKISSCIAMSMDNDDIYKNQYKSIRVHQEKYYTEEV